MSNYEVKEKTNLYNVSYSLLPKEYNLQKQRGYDIIDEIDEEAVLFVGINPSFDKRNDGKVRSVTRCRESGFKDPLAKDGYNHPYFAKPKEIVESLGLGRLSHIDMFSLRERSQAVIQRIVNDPLCVGFVDAQLGLFKRIVDESHPKMLVAINAFASRILRDGIDRGNGVRVFPLGMLAYHEDLGVHVYCTPDGHHVPILFAGMLSGGHALDIGSYERLKWHIGYVLKNF